MNRSGIIVVLVLVAALVGLAMFVATRGLSSRYGEVVVVREQIEVKDSTEFEPSTGRTVMTKQLLIDSVAHGNSFPEPLGGLRGDPKEDWSRLATTYYHREGPLGRVLERFNWFRGPENTYPGDARLPASLCGLPAGSVGVNPLPVNMLVTAWSEPPLGMLFMETGTLASYGRPLQIVDFYERNPAIIEHSTKLKTFARLSHAEERGVGVRVLQGLERPTLTEKGPRRFYHVLVSETSRGNPSQPSHELLTVEAMHTFLDCLAEGGVLCYHISSRDYELDKAVAGAAAECGVKCVVALDSQRTPPVKGHYASAWAFVAPQQAALDRITKSFGPNIVWSSPGNLQPVWRDADRPRLSSVLRQR